MASFTEIRPLSKAYRDVASHEMGVNGRTTTGQPEQHRLMPPPPVVGEGIKIADN